MRQALLNLVSNAIKYNLEEAGYASRPAKAGIGLKSASPMPLPAYPRRIETCCLNAFIAPTPRAAATSKVLALALARREIACAHGGYLVLEASQPGVGCFKLRCLQKWI